jgi:choloylglycine hydrolase
MKYFLIWLCGICVFSMQLAFGCTEVLLPPAENEWVSMRTMDFPIPLHSQIVVEPRGQEWLSCSPSKESRPVRWSNRYGFVGINALGQKQYPEALNEEGLSVATLVLSGTEYPGLQGSLPSLEICDVGAFVAGQCRTVEEVKELLNSVSIWGGKHPVTGQVYELHLVVQDDSGGSLVVEWIKGRMNCYDNPLGVCTNAPELPEQWKNLNRYSHLSPRNVPGWTDKEVNGSGMIGLPGDATSTSRFSRMAVLKRFCAGWKSPEECEEAALHWMGLVWTPKGMINSSASMYTQWGVVRNHTQRTYTVIAESSRVPRLLKLQDCDFSKEADRHEWSVHSGPRSVLMH